MDREKLIDLVRDSPLIWDQNSKCYHDRVTKAKCWERIARELETTSDEAKKKWEYIRDQFRRELKKSQSNRAKSKWPFMENMMFLKDMVLIRKGALKLTTSTNNEESELGYSDDNGTESNNYCPEICTPKILLNEADQIPTSTNTVNVDKIDFNKKLTAPVRRKVRTLHDGFQKKKKYSDDYHFLMSILPSLQRITANRKMKIRAKIMDIITSELDNYEMLSAIPSSVSSTYSLVASPAPSSVRGVCHQPFTQHYQEYDSAHLQGYKFSNQHLP